MNKYIPGMVFSYVRRATLLLMALIAVLGSVGCLTPYPETPDPEQVRLRTEIGYLRASVDRLQNRLEIVQHEQEALLSELDQLRRAAFDNQNKLEQVRVETERRFQAVNQARESDRQFVVDEVTRRISSHLPRTGSPASPTPARVERGRYHEVRPGETLSEIAAAYGVNANMIARANELANPDRLRVGQRLFIPD